MSIRTLSILAVIAVPAVQAVDAFADKSIVCAVTVAKKKAPAVKARSAYDKFRHCSLSCIITRLCNPLDAFNIGVLKEAYDVIGPGSAELADLRADMVGIDIGFTREARSDEYCFNGCDKVYPAKTRTRIPDVN